jgi:acetyl-CoA carboxylase carboxyl transferase subunit beta
MEESTMKPIENLLDEGSFAPVADGLATADPLEFPGYLDSLEKARRAAADESVVCGAGTIGGIEV